MLYKAFKLSLIFQLISKVCKAHIHYSNYILTGLCFYLIHFKNYLQCQFIKSFTIYYKRTDNYKENWKKDRFHGYA